MRQLLPILALCASAAHAGTVGVHTGSYHPGRPDLNAVNPGIYYRTDSGWTAGGYYNSIRRASLYAGYTLQRGRLGLTTGAITGYEGPQVQLLLIPSVRLIGGLRLVYVPQFEKNAQTFHFTYEWSAK